MSTRKVKDTVAYLEKTVGDHYVLHGLPSETLYKVKKRLKLTNAAVEELPHAASDARIHRDTEQPCFYLRVNRTCKSYCVQTEVNGVPKEVTIGRHPTYSAEQARKEARRLLQQMREGRDPVAERRERKRTAAAEKITFERAFEEFLETRDLKASTIEQYQAVVDDALSDWLRLPVTAISRQMVAERHCKLRKSGHHYADYAFRITSAVLNHAAARHEAPDGGPLITSNPVSILSQMKAWAQQKPRTTFIDDHDLPKFLKALDDLRTDKEAPPSAAMGCDALELIVFTGLRKTEALSLKWDDIDLDRGILTLKDTKSGRKHALPLTGQLMELLERRKKHADEIGSDWVFPSPGTKNTSTYLTEPRYIADLVTERCGVKFSIHDLRRTFASAAVRLGINYPAVKRLLNHSTGGDVTLQYTQVTVEDLREAMETITNYFLMRRADMKFAKGAAG